MGGICKFSAHEGDPESQAQVSVGLSARFATKDERVKVLKEAEREKSSVKQVKDALLGKLIDNDREV